MTQMYRHKTHRVMEIESICSQIQVGGIVKCLTLFKMAFTIKR